MRTGARRWFSRAAMLLPFLLASAALAGCGENKPKLPGSTSSPQAATRTGGASPATRRQPAADFERTANRLCADAGSKVTALPPLTQSNFLSQIPYEQELIRGLVARLRPLRPPAAQRRGFARFLSDTAAQPGIIDGAIAALRKRRAGEAKALLTRLAAKGRTADHAAASIGLADCARDYSPVPHPTA
ncbi:MAG: hypothetical protein ACR2K9_01670 [Solirubrobacteraceae bacterium]